MQHPTDQPLSRRSFLLTGSAAAVGVLGAMPAASWARVPGANDRIRLGVIGSGGRARGVMRHLTAQPNVEVVALADVWETSLDRAQQIITTGAARRFRDHRALLDDGSVDAVLIGTPDHWHAPATIDAVRAGKDVYLEKPLAHSIEEGREIVRAIRETGRIVQVGLQQRSGPHYIQAKREFFDTGRIGQVGHVRTWWHGQNPRNLDPALEGRPAGLDWEGWVGPRPMRPFEPRQFYQWRNFADFGLGQIGDLFTHWVDTVHWFMGEDLPRAASTIGGVLHFPDGRDWPDSVGVLVEYPGGWTCSFEASLAPGARGAGIEFLGTAGTLSITRNRYTWAPATAGENPETVTVEGDITLDHARDFIESLRVRRQPTSDVLSAHRSTLISHLANQAYLRKERVQFDATPEQAMSLV